MAVHKICKDTMTKEVNTKVLIPLPVTVRIKFVPCFFPNSVRDGWKEYRRTHSYPESNRRISSWDKLKDHNYQWKTEEGDCSLSLKEMQTICDETYEGTHPFCAINQKETLRCIKEANIMFRDTLRDIDEGESRSETSEPRKKHRKHKKRALAAREKQGQVPALDLRIWDTGASQGMVDKAVVSSKNAFLGEEVSI